MTPNSQDPIAQVLPDPILSEGGSWIGLKFPWRKQHSWISAADYEALNEKLEAQRQAAAVAALERVGNLWLESVPEQARPLLQEVITAEITMLK